MIGGVAQRVEIGSAAVIGAGVMGAAIAAHLANAGIDCLLLDVPVEEPDEAERAAGLSARDPRVRNRRAIAGLQRALKDSPPAFFAPGLAARVRPGNIEDDLPALAQVDWVIEAVVEDPDVKTGLYARLLPHLRAEALLTTNTSGLSIGALAARLPAARRGRFFATHFFNPPRYLKLLELVGAPGTDAALLAGFAAFAETRLGKGCVIAKDTPNFIANRIGTHAFLGALALLEQGVADVATLDGLTGELIGRPKSASFRTADLVGLDTLLAVVRHLHAALPGERALAPSPLLERLVAEGRLGAKSGQGFYRKEGARRDGAILQLDPRTFEYVPIAPADPRALGPAGRVAEVGARIAALVNGAGPAAGPLWSLLSNTLVYAAQCVPEVADEPLAVDRALRWGFGWSLGPFELWDALGPADVAARLAAEGRAVPPLVEELLAGGPPGRFHVRGPEGRRAWSPAAGVLRPVPPRRGVLELAAAPVVERNDSAVLHDLGDGVLCLAFATRLNVLEPATGALLDAALARVQAEGRGLVVGNAAADFSAGANLKIVLGLAEAGRFDEVEALVAGFQQLNLRVRCARRPVVLAPRGLTLGGACEMLLHAAGAVAAAESYIGLPEVGAGLIPAGGGCAQLLRRLDESLPADLPVDWLPHVQRLLQIVGTARVSGSAHEARALGFLSASDAILMSADRVLDGARRRVVALDEDGWVAARPREDLRVAGEAGLAALRVGLFNMAEGLLLSEHDALVTGKLAYVLCGGASGYGARVSERHLLDLEREAFVSLCGEARTRARMKSLLTTGKPLRN